MYPRSFHEFHAQHPTFVRQVIHKNRWARFEDVDDLEQELLAEMLRKQVVEKFNPDVYDGKVNIRLFMAYVISCLERMYASTRIQANAVVRRINKDAVSLSQPLQDDDETTGSLIDALDDKGRATASLEATAELNDLSAYIDRCHPDLNSTMSAIRQHETVNFRVLSALTGVKASTVSGRMTKLLRVARKRNAR